MQQQDNSTQKKEEENNAPESVLNIIKKEFLDMGGHDKDDNLKKSPFYGLSKSVVLQECRAFNDSVCVTQKPEFCSILISKVLYLLIVEGETLSSSEVTDVFFGATKLFQSMDLNLRRMTYLFIKEVAEKTSAEEVIIVVSTLLKDLNSENELFRANSLRVLSRILDASMLAQVERYIKQAIVHKNPLVASSALLCGLYLYSISPEIVRRWVNEINESLSYEDEMVQYHGLLLLYAMKRNDRLALNKLVTQLRSHLPTSPLSICMLIRYSVACMNDDMDSAREVYDMLLKCLRHSNDMVCFEAARALVELKDITDEDLQPLISMLQIHLGSSKTTTKFAAVRILNRLSMNYPTIVEKCNNDLEGLVNDNNRSVATLAVSTLLKTVDITRIEPLLKQIGTYMNEIDDEFKQVLVKSLFSLCVKFPDKYSIVLSFLSTIIRNEGSEALKTSIVDGILQIIKTIPEALESSLFQLCSCIEDCEYPQLIITILYIIAQFGPNSVNPSRFIRFMYNRVILETASVRAAAVQALGVFAGRVSSVRASVIQLLQNCIYDENDEVRNRTVFVLNALQSEEEKRETLLFRSLPLSPEQLKASLLAYKIRPLDGPLDYDHLPVVAVEKKEVKKEVEKVVVEEKISPVSSLAELYKIPAFANYGAIVKSSKSVLLTESETEYRVSLVKHVFDHHVVLQFNILNTIEEQVMTDVHVKIQLKEGDDSNWKSIQDIGCDVVKYNEEQQCYISLEYDDVEGVPEATFGTTIVFIVKDIGEEEDYDHLEEIEGYNEEYPVEDFGVTVSDYISRPILSDYRAAWNELTSDHEAVEKISLPYEDIDTAVKSVIDTLGLHVFEGSDRIAMGTTTHNLSLAGNVMGKTLVMCRCQFILSEEYNCVMKIAIRCEDHSIIELLMSFVQ